MTLAWNRVMHNSCTEHFADGPGAKGQVCKFQNLECQSKKEVQYVCITNAQCNLTLAQSCHQTGSACKRKQKRLTLLSGNGGTPPPVVVFTSSNHMFVFLDTQTVPVKVIQPWVFRRLVVGRWRSPFPPTPWTPVSAWLICRCLSPSVSWPPS